MKMRSGTSSVVARQPLTADVNHFLGVIWRRHVFMFRFVSPAFCSRAYILHRGCTKARKDTVAAGKAHKWST